MPGQTVAYAALTAAVPCDVAGTTVLPMFEQLTPFVPTLATTAFYACAFDLMMHALRVMPFEITNAIWSGGGVVLTAVIGVTVFTHSRDLPALVGIAMIVGGVVVMQALSTATGH